MIGTITFQFLAKQFKVKIFILNINIINNAIKKYSDNDIQIRKTSSNILIKLLPKYYSYTNNFLVLKLEKLTFYHIYDYAINLKSEINPNHKPL